MTWQRRRAEERADAAATERDRLAKAAATASFHYWHCGPDDGCGKLVPSMATLATVCGFDRDSVMGDEIRAALPPIPAHGDRDEGSDRDALAERAGGTAG